MDVWKQYEENEISHSAAHHLMAADELIGRLGYARVSDIARLLNITRGSVSISLQPLKKQGLMLQDENRHLRLSESGQALVDAIKTKRLLLQRLFCEVLGLSPEQADVDACKIEHLISNDAAERLVQLFRFVDSGAADDFVVALSRYHADCGHDPSDCRTCGSACYHESIRRPDTPFPPPNTEG